MSIVSSIVTIILSFDKNYSVSKSITVKGNSAFNAVYGKLIVLTPSVSGQSINL